MDRRNLIVGLASLVAAPAVVRASALMPISGEKFRFWEYRCPILPDIGPRWEAAYKAGISFAEYSKPWLSPRGNCSVGTWTFFGRGNIYSDTEIAFRKEEFC